MTAPLHTWLFWLIVWNTAMLTAYVLEEDCQTRGVLALSALLGTAVFAVFRPDGHEYCTASIVWIEEECVSV